MSYWSGEADGCDFAFGAGCLAVLMIKRRMNQDFETVMEKAYPEQSIVNYLAVLRAIGESHPKAFDVHFGRDEFEEAKENFAEWYAQCSGKIPAKYRDGVLRSAHAEFQLWEERIFQK